MVDRHRVRRLEDCQGPREKMKLVLYLDKAARASEDVEATRKLLRRTCEQKPSTDAKN